MSDALTGPAEGSGTDMKEELKDPKMQDARTNCTNFYQT